MRLKPRWARRLRRGRRFKLRTRVLAGVLGITLTALVAFDFAVVTALRSYLIGQTDSRLQQVLANYGPFRLPANASSGAQKASVPGHCRIHLNGRTLILSGPQCAAPRIAGVRALLPAALGPFLVGGVTGQEPNRHLTLLVKTEPNLTPRLPGDLRALAASGHGQTVMSTVGGQQIRLVARTIPHSGIVVAYTDLGDADSTIGTVELILIIGSAVAGLLAAAGTAWLMRRGLRPVERMATQADKITAGDLTGRVSPQDARTEVGRLGTALNGMLARIEDSVAEREASQQATSRFFADASHELRTPLASLLANAELYQQGALPERVQVDEAMRRIVAEARRMGILVDDMLRLARLDQRPEHHDEPVDVTELAGECVQRARTAHPEHTWRAVIDPGLTISGDEELLRRAIDNLLTNVAAHTPAGTTATITAAQAGPTITVEVSDDGPGVPPDQLPSIFDRFCRASAPSPRPGSGLGLAIVAAATAAHDGTVQAALNHPHGLCVTVRLPATDPADPADPELDDAELGDARLTETEPAQPPVVTATGFMNR
jgi:two-component system, OmpR family, sensor kinase